MVMTIDPGDHQRVTAAVREAQPRTSGEIVTISARSTDHYLDMVLAWGVLAVFLALVTFAPLPPRMLERRRSEEQTSELPPLNPKSSASFFLTKTKLTHKK